MRFARKAIIAGVAAALGTLATALADGEVSVPEIGVALLTAGGAIIAVYQVPNDDPPTDDSPATD